MIKIEINAEKWAKCYDLKSVSDTGETAYELASGPRGRGGRRQAVPGRGRAVRKHPTRQRQAESRELQLTRHSRPGCSLRHIGSTGKQ